MTKAFQKEDRKKKREAVSDLGLDSLLSQWNESSPNLAAGIQLFARSRISVNLSIRRS
jgi:hypothetical protein